MTLIQDGGTISLKLHKSWIAWLLFCGTLAGSIVGFTRYADSKPDRNEVKTIVREMDAPLLEKLNELKADVKDGFRDINAKLDK